MTNLYYFDTKRSYGVSCMRYKSKLNPEDDISTVDQLMILLERLCLYIVLSAVIRQVWYYLIASLLSQISSRIWKKWTQF